MTLMLAQLGAGGIAWLVFSIGLLWCSFSWWRVHRCRLALASACTAIGTVIGAIILIGGSVFVTFSYRTTGPGADAEFIASLFLGGMVLVALAWSASALLLLVSAMRLKCNPEDLFVIQTPQSPTH